MELLWAALAVAVMVLMAWVGFRIEPHWVSKDGRRFLCSGQLMTHHGDPLGRWRETRVVVGSKARQVQIDQKRFLRRSSSFWTLSAESPEPPKRRAVFLLSGHADDGQQQMMALKLPTKSRAVDMLRQTLGS